MIKSLSIVSIIGVVVFLGCNIQKATKPVSTIPSKEVVTTSNNVKKNILFLSIDDLKPLLSNYGESQMHTPNFDRLAEMGMTFTNAHVQYAVCGPSRASVMTGANPDKTKVWDLHTDFRESAPSLISMPEYLISQGYETTAVGKIYHKGSSSPGHDGKSWSMPHQLPDNYDPAAGEAAFSYYQNPETKKRMAELEAEAKAKGITKSGKIRSYVFKRLKPSTENADVSDEAYQDGLYTQTALKQLDDLEKSGKPWFLGVGYQKPHLPFVAPKKYWDLYDRDKIELAKFQQLAEGTPKFAYHSFGELRAFSDIDDKLNIGDKLPEAKQRELIHGYMACISYIDAQIGKLLDELEKRNIIEDTIIVLWGDHGWHLGDHTEWCKHSNFEQATRIPFMFTGPGVAKHQKSHHPVNLVDLFPTVFELANVKQSTQTDGKSLVSLLDDDPSTTVDMDYAYHQYRRNKRMGYSIRTDRYRYTEWHDNEYRSYYTYKEKNIIAREFYDYKDDPLETKNWVDDPKYTSEVNDLKTKLKMHLTK
ncbi:sulfatase [Aureibaculum sp. 2210JD6-5]|uniref:sulfatase n=1 Tax=Aureibaculum sp. 2210JD6-5 TaxID=3103957 RepID=UPI002AAD63F8|nr:sulfatase [Aureibaculum sp. 2210JD6-5]MDY7396802.1 sulfatase [Aureibaculum sp. 2210JD6-5]